jgi:hypothetical protein
MGANVVCLQSDRASEAGGSQSRLTQCHQGVAMVEMEYGKVRMDSNGLGNQSRSALRVIALVGNDAEQVQGVKMPGLNPEDGLVDQLRLFEQTLLVQCQGFVQLGLGRATRPGFARAVRLVVFDSHAHNVGGCPIPDTQKSSLIPAYSRRPATRVGLAEVTLSA